MKRATPPRNSPGSRMTKYMARAAGPRALYENGATIYRNTTRQPDTEESHEEQ